jgi:hypothetical protein
MITRSATPEPRRKACMIDHPALLMCRQKKAGKVNLTDQQPGPER